MFNKIKKNMNMNIKPNRTNKIMILLSLFLILLNESNNIVYAIDYVEPNDIKVENGQLKIIPEKITYKNDKNEEIEIKNEEIEIKNRNNSESIKLLEEIIKSISENNKAKEVTLNYGYLLNGKNLKVDTETTLDEGLLITDSNVFISVKKNNRLTIGNGNNKNSLFGIIGVNNNDSKIKDYLFSNKGETIINTENTLILGNRFIKNKETGYIIVLFNNQNSLTINSKKIYISDNELSLTEGDSTLFNNFGTLTLGSNKTERIIIQNNNIEGNNSVYLFSNYHGFDEESPSTTINSKNIHVINNILSSTEEDSTLFNNSGKLTLGSNKTETLEIKNNKLTGKKHVYLFSNYHGFDEESPSTAINSKNIHVINNILNSTEKGSTLFNNSGTLTLGSNKTETLEIKNNSIEGKYGNSLLFNSIGSTLNINGSKILIKNNTISKYIYGMYYAIYNNGIININLYGDNPTFKMSENKNTKGNKLIADIYLGDIDSKLNFINNSNKKAIIKLGNGIKGEGFVTFKNNDNNNENGSFKVENTYIEANEINIESNVTLLLTINSEGLLGRLKGYNNNSKLNISGDKKLIIEVNSSISSKDKPQEIYTIISGFKDLKGLVDSKKIVLVNEQQIEINGIKYEFLVKKDEIMLKSENKDKKATKKKLKN